MYLTQCECTEQVCQGHWAPCVSLPLTVSEEQSQWNAAVAGRLVAHAPLPGWTECSKYMGFFLGQPRNSKSGMVTD